MDVILIPYYRAQLTGDVLHSSLMLGRRPKGGPLIVLDMLSHFRRESKLNPARVESYYHTWPTAALSIDLLGPSTAGLRLQC